MVYFTPFLLRALALRLEVINYTRLTLAPEETPSSKPIDSCTLQKLEFSCLLQRGRLTISVQIRGLHSPLPGQPKSELSELHVQGFGQAWSSVRPEPEQSHWSPLDKPVKMSAAPRNIRRPIAQLRFGNLVKIPSPNCSASRC